MTHRLEHSSFC